VTTARKIASQKVPTSNQKEPASELARKPWALINLPPFPAVAARILQLLSKEDASMKELAELIRSDVAFSSEVLTMANSALFTFRTEITGILQATVLLGLQRVKAVALTVGMRSYLVDSLKIPGVLACWRHSLACALVCEELAGACMIERDAAYLAGLLHDVGRLALTVVEPLQYSNLLLAAEENTLNMLEEEQKLFGMDHCQAGRWLAQQWKLPPHFAEIAEHHHDRQTTGKFDLLALVQLACRMADCIGFWAVRPARSLNFRDVLRDLPLPARTNFGMSQEDLTLKVAMKINSIE
jgi:putative nucleotidyltransferase with HDIG domain